MTELSGIYRLARHPPQHLVLFLQSQKPSGYLGPSPLGDLEVRPELLKLYSLRLLANGSRADSSLGRVELLPQILVLVARALELLSEGLDLALVSELSGMAKSSFLRGRDTGGWSTVVVSGCGLGVYCISYVVCAHLKLNSPFLKRNKLSSRLPQKRL